MALTVWPGERDALDARYGVGLVDAALTYQPGSYENQGISEMSPDRLALYSDRPNSPVIYDTEKDYVYVDHGESFRRQHAEAYALAGTARVTFGSARWALHHVLDNGGSAYLPERLVKAAGATDRLFELDAPVFERRVYLLTNERGLDSLEWLLNLVESRQ